MVVVIYSDDLWDGCREVPSAAINDKKLPHSGRNKITLKGGRLNTRAARRGGLIYKGPDCQTGDAEKEQTKGTRFLGGQRGKRELQL